MSEVAAGGEHAVVRLANGQLFSFGSNRQGQLGHRPLYQTEGEPSQIKLRPVTPRATSEMLHSCYWLSHGCHMVVTSLSHRCHIVVTSLLYGRYAIVYMLAAVC